MMRRFIAHALSPVLLLALGILCAAERPAHATAQGESLLGVTGHFLHHDQFFPDQPRFWRVEFTIPLLKELGITTVHEAVYALTAPQRALISDGRTDPPILQRVQANRRAVSDWMAQYDKAGIKVVLAVMGHAPSPRSNDNNEEFSTWIAELVAAHPSIVAVQMHNEPNLRSFWRGTPEDYVDTYRSYAAKIRAKRPDVKLVVGAVSSFWWAPGVQWLKRAVDHGVLEFADGIAMHPYNVDAPPETDPQWRGAPASDLDHREKALHAFWAEVSKWNTTGRPLALYFTEFGYNTATQGRGHVDESKQADYLSRSILIFQDVRLRGLPLAGVYWYDLKEDGQKPDNPQHHFGLINWDSQLPKAGLLRLPRDRAIFSRHLELRRRRPKGRPERGSRHAQAQDVAPQVGRGDDRRILEQRSLGLEHGKHPYQARDTRHGCRRGSPVLCERGRAENRRDDAGQGDLAGGRRAVDPRLLAGDQRQR